MLIASVTVIGVISTLIFIGVVLFLLIAVGKSILKDGIVESQRKTNAARAAKKQRRAAAHPEGNPISQVGVQAQGGSGLGCPKCGGTSLRARRSTAARAGVVATGLTGAAVTKRKEVTCQTCGAVYKRG